MKLAKIKMVDNIKCGATRTLYCCWKYKNVPFGNLVTLEYLKFPFWVFLERIKTY